VKTSSDFSSVFREHIAKCKNLRSISENEMAMWYFLMIPSRSLLYTYPADNMRKLIKKICARSLCLVKLSTASFSGIRHALGPESGKAHGLWLYPTQYLPLMYAF